ncbi:hypothetical protein ACOB3G_002346 [Vibrio cholerae]
MYNVKFLCRDKSQDRPLTHFVSFTDYTVIQTKQDSFIVQSDNFSLQVDAIRNDKNVLADLVFTLTIRNKKVKADTISYTITSNNDNWKKGKITDQFYSCLADWVRV